MRAYALTSAFKSELPRAHSHRSLQSLTRGARSCRDARPLDPIALRGDVCVVLQHAAAHPLRPPGSFQPAVRRGALLLSLRLQSRFAVLLPQQGIPSELVSVHRVCRTLLWNWNIDMCLLLPLLIVGLPYYHLHYTLRCYCAGPNRSVAVGGVTSIRPD